ncbi:short-chain dehydrogenase [Companilactobacillus sp. RD055328]|uniref:SDR family NAD(P)-dependent oxidoreductase n=1 Tax=Companilactobacillus sp. RD055328 TaxID=2916634 RepID=UPI001FC86CD2|nr:SDR family NAD(P)-dependent oxidoreductase [Companilactobacillus sp. RD055328]GKQ43325.1 short-chain dehydrogenase [Companilactobacillus sp. RD055328]
MNNKQRTVLISGGTSGVGKAVAKSFAKLGDKVIIIGRNDTKANTALMEIMHETGNDNISYLIGDLSNQEDNKKLSEEFLADHQKLDVLVHCAGIIPKTAKDNINVNLRSHYWLTENLKGSLVDGGQVFIVTGKPLPIKLVPISEKQLTKPQRGMWLLTHKTLLMKLLADELFEQNTTVNSFFPGDIQSDLSTWNKKVKNNKVEVVADIVTDDELSQMSGEFFNDKGKTVSLSGKKYSTSRAREILRQYLK